MDSGFFVQCDVLVVPLEVIIAVCDSRDQLPVGVLLLFNFHSSHFLTISQEHV